MRIALIADLHGNWPAVERLERDLRARDADKLYCLGDIVGKGPSSDRTYDWAMANCDLILGGNWDYFLSMRRFPADAFYWQQLGQARMERLLALPREHRMTLSGRRVRLFHGRPIMERLVHTQADENEIEPFFADGEGGRFDVVGFADAHRQGLRTLSPGLFFNCGSVGNALGEPRVCYALMEGGDGADAPFELRFVSMDYDRERAVRDAEQAPELPRCAAFIREVRTGRYSRAACDD